MTFIPEYEGDTANAAWVRAQLPERFSKQEIAEIKSEALFRAALVIDSLKKTDKEDA